MRFDGAITVANGATGVDPITTPENVPDTSAIVLGKRNQRGTPSISRILLALEGTAAETVTVSLYWRDPDSLQPPEAPVLANARYHLMESGVVVTNGQFQEASTNIPNGGYVYVRVTAETIAADRVLKLVGLS